MAKGRLSQAMSFSTPILFITYTRFDTAFEVFKSISSIRPKKLYFASNLHKPGANADQHEIFRVRSLLDAIDWPCEVFRRYPATHLNVQDSIFHAISWFFEHEEEGIVLEDDCVPHQDFYFYCQDLLGRYRDDPRIWAVSGNSFLEYAYPFTDSYYFSKYFHCWGWASWRRAWVDFDITMASFPDFLAEHARYPLFDSYIERAYWFRIWARLYRFGLPLTWDYQFFYHIFSNAGLVVSPSRNLVQNIGFRPDAENTKDGCSPLRKVSALLPIRHPKFILRNRDADQVDFSIAFLGNSVVNSLKLLVYGLLVMNSPCWRICQFLALPFGKKL
jgi:hypothetical protein